MTSDHRVAGSSPAGCKSSLTNDWQAIRCCKNKNLKRAVIRLLSGFPVLLASLTAHVRITAHSGFAHLVNSLTIAEFHFLPNMKPETTLKLTRRNTAAIDKVRVRGDV